MRRESAAIKAAGGTHCEMVLKMRVDGLFHEPAAGEARKALSDVGKISCSV